MQLAHQPGLVWWPRRGPWQHHMSPTWSPAYNMWLIWYPGWCWQGLPPPFFNEHELQPNSAAHDVPLPSGAAGHAAPCHREYEHQRPTQPALEQYLKYVDITTPVDRQQWLDDHVHWCWQGLPPPFFNEHELQPNSAAHDVPLPSGAAGHAAPCHREYEHQRPTQPAWDKYLKYVDITTPADRQRWLDDYVHRTGTNDRESLLLHAAREFGSILLDDRDFKGRLGHAEYRYRNGQAKHRGQHPRRPRRDRCTSPSPKYVRVNQQLASESGSFL